MAHDNVVLFPLKPTGEDASVSKCSRSVLNRDEREAMIVALALDLMSQRVAVGETIGNPNAAKNYLRLRLGERKTEVFGLLCLDNRHRVLAMEELFTGTIDGASVFPRVVLEHVFQRNAAAVLFFHNHPSGVCEPSSSDRALTERLKSALDLIDVRVLDHMIVSRETSYSFREHGLL